MDVSQLTGTTAAGSLGVQGMSGGGHHHHHHKSIADQVNQLGTAIDSAVKSGTMTSDQATSLKSELADITKTLGLTSTSSTTVSTGTTASTTGSTSQSNPLSQLSDADRKKVFSELQDVRKQVFAAFSSQDADATSGTSSAGDAVSNLFSKIDTDNNGAISKDEFTQFLAQIGANALGYNSNATSNAPNWSSFSAIG
jgi:polyhydroxyalkanoate synthesis regulator phasin